MTKISPTTRGPALAEYKKGLVLTQRQKSIAIGVILGDGSLQTQNKGKTHRIKFEQGLIHKAYMDHLYNEFFPWCLAEPKPPSKNRPNSLIMQTVGHEALNVFADLFLVGPRKGIPANLVRDHVTVISLAYWFMDDGGKLDYGPNKGKAILLHTQGFTKEEVEDLAKGLRYKFNLQAEASLKKGQYVVCISGHSFEDFMRLVEPHIIPEMRYKLPTPRKNKS